MSDKPTIVTLVEKQLSLIRDSTLIARIREFLVDPHPISRDWNYGEPDQKIVCWNILEHQASNTAIVYCDQGFGPGYPWGSLSLSGPNDSMGMDANWFMTIEDAFRTSPAWDGINPPDYEVE